MKKKYDYNALQEQIDAGASYRKLTELFGISGCTLVKAVRRGDLKFRSRSEQAILQNKRTPRPPHSTETKQKISDSRKEYLRKHPDKSPYLLNHYSKGHSYPEKYFLDVFEKEKIDLKHHLQVSYYQLDFYNLDAMVCIEIDGSQHYCDERIVASDKKRTAFLESLGWCVQRINWQHFQKLSFFDKTAVVNKIRQLILDRVSGGVICNIQFVSKPNNVCKDCSCKISRHSIRCQTCSGKHRQATTIVKRKFNPDKEELLLKCEELKWNFCAIGRFFNISDNSVRNRCKEYGLMRP